MGLGYRIGNQIMCSLEGGEAPEGSENDDYSSISEVGLPRCTRKWTGLAQGK